MQVAALEVAVLTLPAQNAPSSQTGCQSRRGGSLVFSEGAGGQAEHRKRDRHDSKPHDLLLTAAGVRGGHFEAALAGRQGAYGEDRVPPALIFGLGGWSCSRARSQVASSTPRRGWRAPHWEAARRRRRRHEDSATRGAVAALTRRRTAAHSGRRTGAVCVGQDADRRAAPRAC